MLRIREGERSISHAKTIQEIYVLNGDHIREEGLTNKDFLDHLKRANNDANPELLRLAFQRFH
jgi:hypothetical protein